MLITFDPTKRQKTIDERQLDFIDAPEVFSGRTYDWEDERYDYGGVRIKLSAGYAAEWSSWCGHSVAMLGTLSH